MPRHLIDTYTVTSVGDRFINVGRGAVRSPDVFSLYGGESVPEPNPQLVAIHKTAGDGGVEDPDRVDSLFSLLHCPQTWEDSGRGDGQRFCLRGWRCRFHGRLIWFLRSDDRSLAAVSTMSLFVDPTR